MNKSLLYVNCVGLIIGISYGLHGPILPIFAKNVIGASYTELGLIGLTNFLPYMFIPLFVGILLDRFNNGWLLAIGVVVNSVSIYLLSIAQSVPELMGFRVMTGIAHAFFWPPSESIISHESKGIDRVKNIGKFTGFFVSGFMIGPLLGTILLENFDATYRFLFQITSYILATALISTIFLSKRKVQQKKRNFSIKAITALKRFPNVIALLIYSTAAFGMILTIFPAFLNDKSFSAMQIELLFFVFGISRIVTLIFTSRLARTTSLTLIVSTLTIALGLLTAFVADSFLTFSVALILMGFGFSIFFPLTLEIILSKTRKDVSGKIIGGYETVFGIGWTLGPIIAGVISQNYGKEAPYLLFFIIGLLVAIYSITKRNTLEPQKNSV